LQPTKGTLAFGVVVCEERVDRAQDRVAMNKADLKGGLMNVLVEAQAILDGVLWKLCVIAELAWLAGI
jgi:hypothetical protein